MIKIGIDARAVTTESRGLRIYACNLIRELVSKDRNVKLVLYTHDPSLQNIVHQSYSYLTKTKDCKRSRC